VRGQCLFKKSPSGSIVALQLRERCQGIQCVAKKRSAAAGALMQIANALETLTRTSKVGNGFHDAC
jgi:hypothetical protein